MKGREGKVIEALGKVLAFRTRDRYHLTFLFLGGGGWISALQKYSKACISDLLLSVYVHMLYLAAEMRILKGFKKKRASKPRSTSLSCV